VGLGQNVGPQLGEVGLGAILGELRRLRDDLAHLYSLTYYPQPNPDTGWRSIKVKLVGPNMKKYHLRTRDGYRLQPGQILEQASAASSVEADPK